MSLVMMMRRCRRKLAAGPWIQAGLVIGRRAWGIYLARDRQHASHLLASLSLSPVSEQVVNEQLDTASLQRFDNLVASPRRHHQQWLQTARYAFSSDARSGNSPPDSSAARPSRWPQHAHRRLDRLPLLHHLDPPARESRNTTRSTLLGEPADLLRPALRRRVACPPIPLPSARLGHSHPRHPPPPRRRCRRQLPQPRHDPKQSQEGFESQAKGKGRQVEMSSPQKRTQGRRHPSGRAGTAQRRASCIISRSPVRDGLLYFYMCLLLLPLTLLTALHSRLPGQPFPRPLHPRLDPAPVLSVAVEYPSRVGSRGVAANACQFQSGLSSPAVVSRMGTNPRCPCSRTGVAANVRAAARHELQHG